MSDTKYETVPNTETGTPEAEPGTQKKAADTKKFPFTVFAYGTGEYDKMGRPDDKGRIKGQENIISTFSAACTSAKTIIDGPDLLGTQVTPNAQKAFDNIIEHLNDPNVGEEEEYVVNLMGLSRGAITCIRIANLLNDKMNNLEGSHNVDEQVLCRKLKNLKLNIFAIDPVAGMGAKQVDESRVIPGNVKNYVSILQLDEMRRDFKPQDITRTIIANPKQTNVVALPFHGNHTQATKIKSNDMQSTALLVQSALYTFLTNNGTTFEGTEVPALPNYDGDKDKKYKIQFTQQGEISDDKLLTLFEKQHKEQNEYSKYGKRSKLGDSAFLRAPRSMNQHKEYYVTDSDFFVNQLERELFKVTYPRTFNYFFERNKEDPFFLSNSRENQVVTDLKSLKEQHPSLFERLQKKYPGNIKINEQGDPINVVASTGSAYLEPCHALMQLYPNLLTQDFIQKDETENDRIMKLKQDIISQTSFYDREKYQFLTFDKRSESDRTQRIRDDVCDIIKHSDGNKEQRLLDVLEYHAQFLHHAGSSSALLPLLKKTLDDHGRSFKPPSDYYFLTILLTEFIHMSLSIVKDTVYFVGSLGFVGGYALSVIGTFLEDFGRRGNEIIGDIGYNPLKLFARGLATVVENVGYVIKQHFGLKPATDYLTDKIRDLRDNTVYQLRCAGIKEKLNDIKKAEATVANNKEEEQVSCHK
jgi:hypothetical protein